MKWLLKVILFIALAIVLYIVIDLVFIFKFNRPLFAIHAKTPYTYIGLFYNTYNCPEYSIVQIKPKGSKFYCSIPNESSSSVLEIIDTTKDMKNFVCAEALEQFYEDDKYQYYYSCIKSKYIIVKYDNGYEETVSDALKRGTIKIEDLDAYSISYIKYDKQ